MSQLAKVLCAVAMSAAMLATPISNSQAQVGGGAVQFRPHRAVYDISFDHATPGSGVADMTGRMVYEMTGTRCGEYAQNMRFVTRMTNQEGVAQVNDLRTSSFEELAQHRLRFSSSQYENQKLSEASQGSAGPGNGASFTEVKLTKPAKKTVKLPSDIYFPIQHSLALVEAARAGHSQFTANLYDGSDKGEKFYETSAVIGPRADTGKRQRPRQSRQRRQAQRSRLLADRHRLFRARTQPRSMRSPTYELSFRFYENGVSSRLYIDYGDFAIRGELKELTFLEEGKCESTPPPRPPVKR